MLGIMWRGLGPCRMIHVPYQRRIIWIYIEILFSKPLSSLLIVFGFEITRVRVELELDSFGYI